MSDCREPTRQIITQWQRQTARPLVVGISGSQGSGKTTLARYLQHQLQATEQLSVVRFSLDDFYKTRTERELMAKTIHPLFKTRTLPGTHDVGLAIACIEQLLNASADTLTAIPVFSKAVDDRLPLSQWHQVVGRPAIILFEGWCLGAQAVAETELEQPLNGFERQFDADARWRKAVNHYLRTDYPPLWALIQRMIFLQIPDFECVFQWREQQERETFADCPHQAMDATSLRQFVEQTERITRNNLKLLPQQADLVLQLDANHACQIMA